MPWVTEEEIQAAKNMTAYEYLRTHQAQRLQKTRTRNEWQLTDHDSFKINELSSKWHWKSRDIGGVSALRFLIEVDGMKFTDAVKLLCEESPSFIPTQSAEKEKPPFKLPERFHDLDRCHSKHQWDCCRQTIIRTHFPCIKGIHLNHNRLCYSDCISQRHLTLACKLSSYYIFCDIPCHISCRTVYFRTVLS